MYEEIMIHLYSQDELKIWRDREAILNQEQPGDEIRNLYNYSASDRRNAFNKSLSLDILSRLSTKTEDLLKVLIVRTYEKCHLDLIWADILDGKSILSRYDTANTPQTRWVVYNILKGLAVIPRSWGMSAATRHFRGVGKNTDKYPGYGLLNKNTDWKEREVNLLVSTFYNDYHNQWLGRVFMEDVSPDPEDHTEDSYCRYGATRKERNDKLILDMVALLEKQTMEPIQSEAKIPKPRRIKTFKPGDKIEQNNLRDLPINSHLEWKVVEYEKWDKNDSGIKETRIYDLVFLRREKNKLIIRPVVDGRAFGETEYPSSAFYGKSGYGHVDYFVRKQASRTQGLTYYLGTWTGEILDVQINLKSWKQRKD
jgi:hypothetical protein